MLCYCVVLCGCVWCCGVSSVVLCVVRCYVWYGVMCSLLFYCFIKFCFVVLNKNSLFCISLYCV